jgi:AhpD family alkylhydroperoxidase
MDARFNMFDNEIAAKFSKRFSNASLVIQQSPLPKSTQELVSLRASQINGCGWCIDMHTKEAAAAGETSVRLNLVAAWREAIVFTEAEQAALALAEEGTRLADAHHGVSDETWAQVRKHYDDDDQIVALVSLVALINAANWLAVIVHLQGVPTSSACSPPRSADRQPNPGPACMSGHGYGGPEHMAETGDLAGQAITTSWHGASSGSVAGDR